MKRERRGQRSGDCQKALRYQLEASIREAPVGAMILADDDGLCLAHAGPGYPSDEIAANMTLVGRQVENFQGRMLSTTGGWNMRIRRFVIDDMPFYLGAVDDNGHEQGASQIHHSIGAVKRILAENGLAG